MLWKLFSSLYYTVAAVCPEDFPMEKKFTDWLTLETPSNNSKSKEKKTLNCVK